MRQQLSAHALRITFRVLGAREAVDSQHLIPMNFIYFFQTDILKYVKKVKANDSHSLMTRFYVNSDQDVERSDSNNARPVYDLNLLRFQFSKLS